MARQTEINDWAEVEFTFPVSRIPARITPRSNLSGISIAPCREFPTRLLRKDRKRESPKLIWMTKVSLTSTKVQGVDDAKRRREVCTGISSSLEINRQGRGSVSEYPFSPLRRLPIGALDRRSENKALSRRWKAPVCKQHPQSGHKFYR